MEWIRSDSACISWTHPCSSDGWLMVGKRNADANEEWAFEMVSEYGLEVTGLDPGVCVELAVWTGTMVKSYDIEGCMIVVCALEAPVSSEVTDVRVGMVEVEWSGVKGATSYCMTAVSAIGRIVLDAVKETTIKLELECFRQRLRGW